MPTPSILSYVVNQQDGAPVSRANCGINLAQVLLRHRVGLFDASVRISGQCIDDDKFRFEGELSQVALKFFQCIDLTQIDRSLNEAEIRVKQRLRALAKSLRKMIVPPPG